MMISRLLPCVLLVATAALSPPFTNRATAAPPESFRVMTFNASLWRDNAGDLISELGDPDLPENILTQIRRVGQVIQYLRPDILLLNEFDHDENSEALTLFHDRVLGVGQFGESPITYPHRFTAPSNTGVHSGVDLDGNGVAVDNPGTDAHAADAFGFGKFAGQYGMVVLSKYPIKTSEVRTFREFLWKDMPDNVIPPGYYSPEAVEVFRLSSKSHWDLPIDLGGTTFHLLTSHPTPPVFDGTEDRNGRRNHDEIRFWGDYVTPGKGGYIYDDEGVFGGLVEPARFVVAGDLNADPISGDSFNGAIHRLLDAPPANGEFVPIGAAKGRFTATFNLRADYVVPSNAGLHLIDGAVLYPAPGQPLYEVLGGSRRDASDHRPVYLDLAPVPLIDEAVDKLETSSSGGDISLNWFTAPGISYAVTHSDDDLDSWSDAESAGIPVMVNPETGVATATDPIAAGRRFYRVEAWFTPEPEQQ